MSREMNNQEIKEISAGCGECLSAIEDSLEACSMDELYAINQVFKQVLLSPEMLNADSDTKKNALITAIQNFDF